MPRGARAGHIACALLLAVDVLRTAERDDPVFGVGRRPSEGLSTSPAFKHARLHPKECSTGGGLWRVPFDPGHVELPRSVWDRPS